MKNTNRIKRYISKKIYDKLRQEYLKYYISNIGRIVEEEDKIICYVDQKSLEKYKGNNPIYELKLYGMNQVTDGIKEQVKKLGLDKPVYYIFDGINFNTAVKLVSRWATIVFKNCTFNKGINVLWCDNIVFENNKYIDWANIYFTSDIFMNINRVNELTFINEEFKNSYEYTKIYDTNFGMRLNAKRLNITNCIFGDATTTRINITSEETRLYNSNLKAKEIHLNSESIKSENSTFMASDGIEIDNQNSDFNSIVYAPIVFYNGIVLEGKNNNVHEVNSANALLNDARKEFLTKLYEVYNQCRYINNQKLENLKTKLEKQQVLKLLKKKG